MSKISKQQVTCQNVNLLHKLHKGAQLCQQPGTHVRACVYVRVSVCARMHGCTRVLNITHVFAGVCQWKKPEQASRERCESDIFMYLFYVVILNVPS